MIGNKDPFSIEDGILYVREENLKRRSQVDRIRGVKVRGVVVSHDHTIPLSLQEYLFEVLAPIIDEAKRNRGE